ncbi:sensor histidine kinase [Treponema sp.]
MARNARLPRFRSIQVSMAFAFSLLSVSTIGGAILISYSVTEETARISSRTYTEQLVSQIANNIESYIDYMDSVSAFVQADQEVQDYLDVSDSRAKKAATPHVSEVLETLSQNRKDISLVAVFGYDGSFVAHDANLRLNPYVNSREQTWFTEAKSASGRPVISSSQVQNVIQDHYRWVISLSREIIDKNTGRGAGILLVDLNYEVIERICGSVSLGKRGYIFVVDKNGAIVYHPQQQLIYGGLKTEGIRQVIQGNSEYFASEDSSGDKLYSVRTMAATGWKVVAVNFRGELVENRDTIRRSYTAWGLAFFAVAIALSIILSRGISRPIKELRKSMQTVEQGNFDIRVDVRSSDEIGELGKDFNIMIAEIKDLLGRVTVQQELKRKSELKALQMQINPHFLYNTLDSVIWMAEGGKHKEVIAMSSALARLFRLSISKGKEIINIQSEIEHVSSYLTIQKIRYKDKLDYRISVHPELYNYRTVKIILQPLVENAIYHGIKNKAGVGTITIGGKLVGETVELFVQDDGSGMGKAALKRIQDRLNNTLREDEDEFETEMERSGLGIRNVDERIKLYFGSEYGLVFESTEHEGTTVRVRLPALLGSV